MLNQSSTNFMLVIVAIILFFLVGLRGFDEWTSAKPAAFTSIGSSNSILNAPPINSRSSGGSAPVNGGSDPSQQLTDPGGVPNAFSTDNNQIQIKLK